MAKKPSQTDRSSQVKGKIRVSWLFSATRSSQTDRSSESKSKPKSRTRKWLIFGGLIFVLIGAVPAWINISGMLSLASARKALQNERHEEALDSLRTAKKLMPNSVEVEYLLAVTHRRMGNPRQALDHLEAAEKLGLAGVDLRKEQLLLQAKTDKFLEVATDLQRLANMTVDNQAAAEMYQALSVGFLTANRHQQALDSIQEWIARRPAEPEPRLFKVETLLQIGEPEQKQQVVKECRQLLELAPQNGEVTQVLAATLLDLGQVDKAAKEFQRCLQWGRKSPEILIGLADCQIRVTQLEPARRLLDDLLLDELEPRQRAKGQRLLGQMALAENDIPQAIKYFLQSTESWPFDDAAHQQLAQAYANSGNNALAQRHTAIGQKIADIQQRMSQAMLRLQQEPNNADLHFEIGRLQEALGKPEAAPHWWSTALQCDPYHERSRQALAEVQRRHADQLKNQQNGPLNDGRNSPSNQDAPSPPTAESRFRE